MIEVETFNFNKERKNNTVKKLHIKLPKNVVEDLRKNYMRKGGLIDNRGIDYFIRKSILVAKTKPFISRNEYNTLSSLNKYGVVINHIAKRINTSKKSQEKLSKGEVKKLVEFRNILQSNLFEDIENLDKLRLDAISSTKKIIEENYNNKENFESVYHNLRCEKEIEKLKEIKDITGLSYRNIIYALLMDYELQEKRSQIEVNLLANLTNTRNNINQILRKYNYKQLIFDLEEKHEVKLYSMLVSLEDKLRKIKEVYSYKGV